MVFNFVPSLPRYPGFKGKVTNPSFILFRSRGWLDHVSASKVSVSADSRLIDVCRYGFDSAASTDESNDSVSTLWRVTGWLCSAGMSVVSLFVFSCRFVTDMLDLDLYRSDLDGNMSTPGSNDPMHTFHIISAWLRCAGAFLVSRFDFWHLADSCRYGFDSSASTSMPNVSIWTICRSDRWP